MDANGPYKDHAFMGETLTTVISMDSTITSLTGVALQYRLWAFTQPLVPSPPILVSYAIGPNLIVNTSTLVATVKLPTGTALAGGLPMTQGRYQWELFRLDSGIEAVLCYGELTLRYRP